jgi:hypothetical protein
VKPREYYTVNFGAFTPEVLGEWEGGRWTPEEVQAAPRPTLLFEYPPALEVGTDSDVPPALRRFLQARILAAEGLGFSPLGVLRPRAVGDLVVVMHVFAQKSGRMGASVRGSLWSQGAPDATVALFSSRADGKYVLTADRVPIFRPTDEVDATFLRNATIDSLLEEHDRRLGPQANPIRTIDDIVGLLSEQLRRAVDDGLGTGEFRWATAAEVEAWRPHGA